MGDVTTFRLSVWVCLWLLWIVPLYRLLGRAGFARGWAFVAIPPLGLVLLWFIAFSRWPGEREAQTDG